MYMMFLPIFFCKRVKNKTPLDINSRFLGLEVKHRLKVIRILDTVMNVENNNLLLSGEEIYFSNCFMQIQTTAVRACLNATPTMPSTLCVQCIPLSYVCDKDNDCPNSDDETPEACAANTPAPSKPPLPPYFI